MKNILNIEITRPNQVLIIMRGIPGSGKSTLAKTLVEDGIIHSTDGLVEATGDYVGFFKNMTKKNDFSPLGKMHSMNHRNVKESILANISPVIVDNTNIKKSEAKKYIKTALELGLDEKNIKIVDIGTNELTAEELFERNTHSVPLEVIIRMIETYNAQGEFTVKTVLGTKEKSDVLYSGVVLDACSRGKLLSMVGCDIPKDWVIVAHHMTIKLGELEDKCEIGKYVTLIIQELGLSDLAMAVKVTGYHSDNKIPHVTVAINPNGGKPVDSNYITDWKHTRRFTISGIVTEIKK